MLKRTEKQVQAARRIIEHAAEYLQADLSVKLWDGTVVPLGRNAQSDITLTIRSPAAIRRLIFSPRLITIVELYGAGDIDIEGGTPLQAARRWDHLKALRLARNADKRIILRSLWPFLLAGSADSEIARGYEGAIAARPEGGRNNKKLIQFHYDVSNAFYALFLDPEMVYSSAYFARPDMSLEEAQIAKLDMICRRLRLQAGDHLLDIGCGWGGLICHAARSYGVTALGVTLSQEQYNFCQEKIARLGLSDRVTVDLRDYSTLEEAEAFDAVAQIGMFEHIGIDNHDAYFALIHRVLRPRGRYLHHSITRRPTRDLRKFRRPTAYAKVISRFIFPGGELDYLGMTLTDLERNGFEIHDVQPWREHYQRSLELWSERLAANRQAAEKEVGATTTKLWLLYFALSAIAFERNIAFDFQTLATKRQAGPSGIPMSPADLYR